MTTTTNNDQTYEFFVQESLELLHSLEHGLLNLSQEHDLAKLHDLMRSAHSIKGGAACVGLMEIQQIAHQLENAIRALYAADTVFDVELESLLLQAFDFLRLPLVEQIQTGQSDAAQALQQSRAIFSQLEKKINRPLEEAAELPEVPIETDMIQFLFETEISSGLQRWGTLLSNSNRQDLLGDLKKQAEVFSSLGKMLALEGWSAIADTTLQALSLNPESVVEIGQFALGDFLAGQEAVLAGDRIQGGQPSLKLAELAETRFEVQQEALPSSEQTLSTGYFLQTVPDIEASDSLFGELVLENIETQNSQLSEDQLSISGEVIGKDPITGNSITDNLTAENLVDKTQALENISTELKTEALEDFNPDDLSSEDSQDEKAIENGVLSVRSPSSENFPPESSNLENLNLENLNLENLNLENLNLENLEPEDSDPESIIRDILTHGGIALDPDITDSQEVSDLNITSEEMQSEPDSSSLVPVQKLDHQELEQASNDLPQTSTVSSDSDLADNSPIDISQRHTPATNHLMAGIRTDMSRLGSVNTLVGELATQDNSLFLQDQSTQKVIKTLERSQAQLRKIITNLQIRISQLPKKKSSQRSVRTASYLEKMLQKTIEEADQIREAIYEMKVLNLRNTQLIQQRQQTLQKVQKSLTEIQMVPVEALLNRFPRMIRDLCVQHKKQVELKLQGEDTLLDRAVLEKLYDPLVHLVRNAFDHGIEPLRERQRQGKATAGTIEIRAYQRGNYTYLEIQDDGRGIDLDKIRKKAVEKNIISLADVDRLSEEQLYELLFYPDFSTRDQVNYLSGRGVGLEAVHQQIEALKGNISIYSHQGRGTQFTLRLPWMQTITKLLVFQIQGYLFAIPLDALTGIVSVSPNEINHLDHQETYDWYGQPIPLVQSILLQYNAPYLIQVSPANGSYQKRSSQLQEHTLTHQKSSQATNQKKVMLLLISQGLDSVAVKVDDILMEQNLTIKPFGSTLKPPAFLYGCTALGDSRSVPVIDSAELLEFWTQRQSQPTHSLSSKPNLTLLKGQSKPDKSMTVLVIDDSVTARQTLVLSLQKVGYKVLQAQHGHEGLTQLQKYPQTQIVICDLEMPEMNGFEFLFHCRQRFSPEKLPVLILTSRNNERHRKMAHQLGASEYMTKPYAESELLQALSEFQDS
ncbi:MAG: response regulator [Microcoleaceae cyanobacterium]